MKASLNMTERAIQMRAGYWIVRFERQLCSPPAKRTAAVAVLTAKSPSSAASLSVSALSPSARPARSQGGQDIRADYISKLPKKDLFAHLDLPVHRCALVSSGAALLGSGLGPKIDSHHLVRSPACLLPQTGHLHDPPMPLTAALCPLRDALVFSSSLVTRGWRTKEERAGCRCRCR